MTPYVARAHSITSSGVVTTKHQSITLLKLSHINLGPSEVEFVSIMFLYKILPNLCEENFPALGSANILYIYCKTIQHGGDSNKITNLNL